MPAPEGLAWEVADLTDPAATEALICRVRPDVIAHLASQVSGGRDPSLVLPTLQANLGAAVNVMLAAQAVGCQRVVLAGSMEEPDPTAGELVPSSPYSAAKMAAHSYSRMFHALYGLPVVNLRVAMTYGPGQGDLRKLVPYTIVSLLRDEAPQLMSGDRKVDWVYVDDVVDAFIAAMIVPAAVGESFDIGCGVATTTRAVVEKLQVLIGSPAVPTFGGVPDRQLERAWVANIEHAERTLGWVPATTLDQGLAMSVDHYRGMLNRRESPGGHPDRS